MKKIVWWPWGRIRELESEVRVLKSRRLHAENAMHAYRERLDLLVGTVSAFPAWRSWCRPGSPSSRCDSPSAGR